MLNHLYSGSFGVDYKFFEWDTFDILAYIFYGLYVIFFNAQQTINYWILVNTPLSAPIKNRFKSYILAGIYISKLHVD